MKEALIEKLIDHICVDVMEVVVSCMILRFVWMVVMAACEA